MREGQLTEAGAEEHKAGDHEMKPTLPHVCSKFWARRTKNIVIVINDISCSKEIPCKRKLF